MMTFDRDTQQKVNFKRIYQVANEILASSSVIETFPYKAKELVHEQSDIVFCSFKKATKYKINIKQFGSESAVLTELCGAFVLFYNQDEAIYRIRFSILHEFGHYILGHRMNLSMDNPLYALQEIEANCFAAQLLMPEQLLRECMHRGKAISVDFIRQSFDVSPDAAQRRKNTLAKNPYEWRSREEREYDDIIILRFASKLDEIAPKSNHYSYDYEEDFAREEERNHWLYER